MPFLEVFDFTSDRPSRERANKLMTEALCASYEIEPDIVSAYFVDVGHDAYGHAGHFISNSIQRRIFVKLHAFPRPEAARRKAAQSLTEALSEAYDTDPHCVAIYFLDRAPEEVAHAGVLASD